MLVGGGSERKGGREWEGGRREWEWEGGESGREGGGSGRKGGRELEEGREGMGGRRVGLPFTASLESFPIETSTNGAQTLHLPTGQTLIRL